MPIIKDSRSPQPRNASLLRRAWDAYAPELVDIINSGDWSPRGLRFGELSRAGRVGMQAFIMTLIAVMFLWQHVSVNWWLFAIFAGIWLLICLVLPPGKPAA